MQPVLHPRCEIDDVNESCIVTREPMLDLAPEHCPTVQLFFENRRKEPNLPVLITLKRQHQRIALELRQETVLATRRLAQLKGILDEVGELLAQGVHDVLGGGEVERPSLATSANRVYEPENARRVDDARVVSLGVRPPHTQLRQDIPADKYVRGHATCPGLDEFKVSDGLV